MSGCRCGAPWPGHDVCDCEFRAWPTRPWHAEQRGGVELTAIELTPAEKAGLSVGSARLPPVGVPTLLGSPMYWAGVLCGIGIGAALALAAMMVPR